MPTLRVLITANFDSLGQRGLYVTTLLPKAPPGLYVAVILLDVGETESENLSYISSSVVGKIGWNMSARKNNAKDRVSYFLDSIDKPTVVKGDV